ncbi:LPD7 domain-containing protein [Photobacterium damselae]|uniref:LPD7 domain-containing protein n=1 Tax=Photobacterium damselae TaxID=38293 RepID=UPI001EFD61B3|nr:LPD7 domain-containing protein [Photobacterium damselae]MCG9706474.1 relaxase [Photobacterium damselae]
MLIRATGAHSGIVDYLEKGIKNGRDFTRDELDERVVLVGNLKNTGTVIDSIDTEADRYLHLTLSFKEDNVPQSTLEGVVKDFEAFAMAAYRPDEYQFYAEAHLPKIKSYTDKKNGELVERKPHIHVVIPKTALITGKHLEPLGLVTQNTSYIDAFQEITNEKYGLASPKVNLRTNFTDESTILARQKGDNFKGANKVIKTQILDTILEKDIQSVDALAKELEHQGFEVKTRNVGKDNCYLNIKDPSKPKGINLKNTVFTERFLALPQEEKQAAAIPKSPEPEYLEPSKGNYQAGEKAHQTLAHWHKVRAHEIRHLTRRSRAPYKQLSPEKKQAWLQEKIDGVFKEVNYERTTPSDRISTDERHYATGRYNRTIGHHLHSAQRHCEQIEPRGGRLLDRRALRIVCASLQRRADDQKPPQYRYLDPRIGTARSCALSDRLSRFHQQQRISVEAPSTAHIQKNLNAQRLLQTLHTTHQLNPDKYTITKGKDGSDRILCGNHNLNVGDFLTKELHMPWREAKAYLEKEYQRQHRVFEQVHSQSEFKYTYQLSIRQARNAAWQAQFKHEKAIFGEIRQGFYTEKQAIWADKSLSHADRCAAISIAAMNKTIADINYKRERQLERQTLKTAYPSQPNAQYKLYQQRTITTETTDMDTATGTITKHGRAPYKHIKGNSQSYYVTLQNTSGRETTIWGKGLEKALKDEQVDVGSHVQLEKVGSKHVDVPTTIRDGEGKVLEHSIIDAVRNKWEAKEIPEPAQTLSPDSPIKQPIIEKEIDTQSDKAIDAMAKSSIDYKEPTKKEYKEAKKTSTEKPMVTRATLDKKFQMSRLFHHYPKLKELDVDIKQVNKTPKGDIIKYQDKEMTVTQFAKTALELKTFKEVVKELTPHYQAQERDNARVIAHKEKFMNNQRKDINTLEKESLQNSQASKKEKGNNKTVEEKPIAKMQSKDAHLPKEQARKPLPPQQFDNVTHKINKEGHVSYYLNKDKIVVDRGRDIYLTHPSDKATEIALRLSANKFGTHLDVNGTQEYKDKIVEIAVKEKMPLTFTDPKMNERYQELQAYQEKGMAIIQKAQDKYTAPEQNKQEVAQKQIEPSRSSPSMEM